MKIMKMSKVLTRCSLRIKSKKNDANRFMLGRSLRSVSDFLAILKLQIHNYYNLY